MSEVKIAVLTSDPDDAMAELRRRRATGESGWDMALVREMPDPPKTAHVYAVFQAAREVNVPLSPWRSTLRFGTIIVPIYLALAVPAYLLGTGALTFLVILPSCWLFLRLPRRVLDWCHYK